MFEVKRQWIGMVRGMTFLLMVWSAGLGVAAEPGSLAPSANDESWEAERIGSISAMEEIKLTPSDGTADDQFGTSVAADGDVCIAGAPYGGLGSAYVFRLHDGAWIEEAKLTGSGGYFGESVSIRGDLAVVGAPRVSETAIGAVFVFRFADGVWTEEARLTAADGAEGDRFGTSVSITDQPYAQVLVGAPGKNEWVGAAYLFRLDGSTWSEVDKWTPNDDSPSMFGSSVSIIADMAVVGAPEDDDHGTKSGSAYVFRFHEDTWLEEAKLTAGDAATMDRFGCSVATTGSVVLVGAEQNLWIGAAYVFRYDQGVWVEEMKLTPTDWGLFQFFGYSVWLDDTVAVVGAIGNHVTASEPGSVYVFAGADWTETRRMAASDASHENLFGASVAVAGHTVLVGAPHDSAQGFRSGAVYVYPYVVTTDCNSNDVPDWMEQDRDFDGWIDDCDNCPDDSNSDQEDVDTDGLGDVCDPCTDTDGDGLGDPGFSANTCPIDDCPNDPGNDDDADGICFAVDNCPDDPNGGQEDADEDGLGDVCDLCTDTDGDGLGDPGFPANMCPIDDCPNDPGNDGDNDGVCESVDNCPDTYNPDQVDDDDDGAGNACDVCPQDPENDTDRDGVCGDVDNCPTVDNPYQDDIDGDGAGDACDPCPNDPLDDVDGDTFCADVDNCPDVYNHDQADSDQDGAGDACDDDMDNDGVSNSADNCPKVPNPGQVDTDDDGVGDACDNCPVHPNGDQSDRDADDIGDACDNCRDAANSDQADNDLDGLGNICDNCVDHVNPEQLDCDGDGVGDVCTIAECPPDDPLCGDINGSGVPDVCEYLKLYVDARATGADNGTSWADAYTSLQDALYHATVSGGVVDEIRVAHGVYRTDDGRHVSAGDRSATFQLLSGVALRGGYAGFGAGNPDERDTDRYESVLSGDLADDGRLGESSCCVSGPFQGCDDPTCEDLLCDMLHPSCCEQRWRGDWCAFLASRVCCDTCRTCDNSYHVVTGSAVDASAVLEGFTVTGGVANEGWDNPDTRGGGMSIIGGNPTVRHCRFEGNLAERGGGVAIEESYTVFFEDCLFSGNGAFVGAGLYADESEAVVIRCSFSDNTAEWGAGLYERDSWVRVFLSRFTANRANEQGGAMRFLNGHATVAECLIDGNAASYGGAAACYGTGWFVNSTVVDNRADVEGGGLHGNCGLDNGIAWGNRDRSGTGEASQIQSTGSARYSCIQGWTGTGDGNIALDPHFTAPGHWMDPGTPRAVTDDLWVSGDYRLVSGSPCIDAGHNWNTPDDIYDLDGDGDTSERIPIDFLGNARYRDDEATQDTGIGGPPVIDMGATEFIVDCNGNHVPDDEDLEIGSSCDCNANGIPDECEPDCNDNGIADACDIDGGFSDDCTGDGVPDECDPDCNGNGIADTCDIGSGYSIDCTGNGVPDECEPDCNSNGVADSCDIASGPANDCDANGVPDECEPPQPDCNRNGVGDRCDIALEYSEDRNANGIPDFCDGTVLLVDGDNSARTDAQGWTGAYGDLQEALTLAAADRRIHSIWIAGGTYIPSGEGDRCASFELADQVGLYGGFAGVESSLAQRDWRQNETVLSGDLTGDDNPDPGSDCCYAHAGAGCDQEACEDRVCSSSLNRSCCSDEWTQHCADVAASVCADACILNEDNSCHVIKARDVAAGTVLDGFVVTGGNTYGPECDSNDGAGLNMVGGSAAVRNCTFKGNRASYDGGGIYAEEASLSIQHCMFVGNKAGNPNHYNHGGGIYIFGESSLTVVNSLFTQNAATYGGAVCARFQNAAFENCTFAGNIAVEAGGAIDEGYAGGLVDNCVFFRNRRRESETHIWSHIRDAYQLGTVNFSCLPGFPVDELNGTGNIDDDPLFVEPGEWQDPGTPYTPYDDIWVGGDCRLRGDSPAVNAGDPASEPEPGHTDLDGHPRRLCGRVDMGAFEYGMGDYGCDRDVDLADYERWQACVTGPSGLAPIESCGGFDFEHDGDVDLKDIAAFQRVFTGP